MKNYDDKIKKHVLPVIGFESNVIEYASGMYLIDVDNNKFLDMCGGQFCSIFGHSNSQFDELFDRLKKIQHTNTSTLVSSTINTYEKINNLIPEINGKIITLTTGAEAIEFAMRYAKNYTGKTSVISFDRGYHGLSLGAQTITYGGQFSKPYIENVYSIPTFEESMTKEDIDKILSNLEKICESDDDIAAIFIEPIVGVGGVHKLSQSFAKRVREICDRYNVFLVFDECQSGFGRAGSWFYYQTLDVVPDILVTAKGVGLGFPVSLVVVNGSKVEEGKVITHYSSHQNDPFGSEIIDFAINYISKNDLINKCSTKGEILRRKINDLKCPYFSKVRGDGLMLGFDLVVEGITNYRKVGLDFRNKIKSNGCLVQGTNGGETIRLLPSYEISLDEIDEFIRILKLSVETFDFGGYHE